VRMSCRSCPAGHEIQRAKRSAFFVGITTLSERTIWFQATTRVAREISVCFGNRFGFGKIEAQKSKAYFCARARIRTGGGRGTGVPRGGIIQTEGFENTATERSE